jgi:hypothetical protein
MDKKLLSRIFLLSLSGALLVGCGDQATETPEDTEDTAEAPAEDTTDTEETADEVTFTVDIVVEGEEVADLSQEITAEEGTYLLDVMHENYDIEEADGFISAIEGYEQDDENGLYWLYYINDESAEVGAADYAPEEADQIEWRLEGFE